MSCFFLHLESFAAGAKPVSTPVPQLEPPLEFGEIWDAEQEINLQSVLDTTQAMLLKRSEGASFIRRDAHPKHHGCVKADFVVDSSSLAPELRVGIFAENTKKVFPAIIRFSNGNPDGGQSADLAKDIRGMAVKLINIEGTKSGSQDFVMLTSKEFFSKNGKDYHELHDALGGGSLSTLWYLLLHGTERSILLNSQIEAANPLQLSYFSSVPYKLGARTMKFKVEPCAVNPKDTVPGKDANTNYLRERLASSLAKNASCFDFFVEPNMDMETQPVENPMIPWDETKSPYIKVASIQIPVQQGSDSEGQLNFCENLSFDPWHTLPGTRPMGQINRMRAKIYPFISSLRHQYNNTPILEPRDQNFCAGESAALCAAPKH